MKPRTVLPVAAAAAALAAAATTLTPAGAATTATSLRFFAADSPWNTPLPPAPVIDRNSARWVNAIKDGAHVANIGDYGVPIYHADATDRRFKGPLRYAPALAPNPFTNEPAPLRSKYRASSGTDGAMGVVRDDKTYEFWQSAGARVTPSHRGALCSM